MAAGEADRRADAVGVEERSAVRCPLMKRLYISMPPDLTMMVEEVLALIERPPPPPEEREMNELIRRTLHQRGCRGARPSTVSRAISDTRLKMRGCESSARPKPAR
jgi:hypothetical protein